ncbi:ImmA/IrrE family metallo-endopeptidase [Candidatus Dojkabacteria bacterium]|nr:ImmA/IrrE family metallo-endopeptidase [Candidatus Dojkabacteria bacterium]
MINDDKRSRNQIRKYSDSIVTCLDSQSPPVVLKKVLEYLEKELQLTIHTQSRSLSDNLSGIYVRSNDTVGIMYNSNHSVNRQRFTVAHEFGHLVLGHAHKDPEHKEIGDINSEDDQEREANIFASELLMPFKWLKKDMKDKSFTTLELSLRYRVSELALGWRLSNSNALLLS